MLLEPYSYAGGSPQNNSDPSGLDWWDAARVLVDDVGWLQYVPFVGTGLDLAAAYSALRACDMAAASGYLATAVMSMVVGVAFGAGALLVRDLAKAAKGAAHGEAAAARAAVRGESQVADRSVTSILLEHVAVGRERFLAEGLTEGQERALLKSPRLRSAFVGERIDTFAKESAALDPRLRGIQITGRFHPGADFKDPATGRWWDITTPGQWPGHVRKYGPGGTMLPY